MSKYTKQNLCDDVKILLTETVLANQSKYDSKKIRKMLNVIENINQDQAIKILKSQLNEMDDVESNTVISILGLVFWPGPILWVMYRLLKASYDKCESKCGVININTPSRQYCLADCKIMKVKKQIEILKKVDCSKQSNPSQCRIDQKEALDHANAKLKYLETWKRAAGKHRGGLF